jgi:glycosyltransferase involved in cell wall biosynthesis
MLPDNLSVTLSVGLAPYQRTLVAALERAGILRRTFDLRAGLEILEPNGTGGLKTIERFRGTQFSIRVVWAIWRRLPQPIRPRPPVQVNVWLYDNMIAKRLPPSTIFHGCTSACLASLEVAKRNGSITLVESASRHPKHWAQTEVEESRHFGVDTSDGSGNLGRGIMGRQEEEYRRCDRIVVPSTVARQSYEEFGYGEKTEVVLTGVDADFFVPKAVAKAADPKPSTFRVCYVGRVELSKGLGYLLQAWKRLCLPNAELVLVGAVNEHMRALLREYGGGSVRVTGYLFAPELRLQYQNADLFVLPSPNEGLAQVMLEAMACGLPVVATEMSGARDCITDSKEGMIVPSRNVDALCDSIRWCYEHREEARAMGVAARARVEREFTLEHYNQRVIALYRRLSA